VTAERGRRVAGWLAAVVAGLALAVMPAASPAHAADQYEQQAAKEIAAARCETMRAEGEIPDKYKENCEQRLEEDLLSGKAGESSWLNGLCKWVPDLPIIGNPCERLLDLMRGTWEDFQNRVKALRGTVNAITNPVETAFANFSEMMSNALKTVIQKVFPELVHITSPNVASKGFVSSYAAGAGLAMFVLVVMLGRLFYGASQDDITGEELAESLWRWLPTALIAVLFGPGLGYLLVMLSDSISVSIVNYFAGDIASLVTKLQTMVALGNSALIPGGPLVGVVIQLIALMGMVGLVGGLLVQLLALYLTGAIMAFAFALLVDPRTRKKALKLPFTWVGLTFAKPLLFFLIGAIARMADAAFTVDSIEDDGVRSLVTAVVAALALALLGLAPWSLLKFAPVLPDGSSSRVGRASKSQSSGTVGGLANSTMMQLAYRRHGGSPGGGGGGQPSPAMAGGPPTGQGAPNRPPTQNRQPQPQGQGSTASGSGTPGTGQAGAKPATGGTGTPAPAMAGTGTGAAGARAGATGAAGSGAAGGAAGGAGGAAGGAAAAGAGAATGGIATAALLGVQAADAAKRKAQDAANRASDVTPEG
jgi:hypothetical protein